MISTKLLPMQYVQMEQDCKIKCYKKKLSLHPPPPPPKKKKRIHSKSGGHTVKQFMKKRDKKLHKEVIVVKYAIAFYCMVTLHDIHLTHVIFSFFYRGCSFMSFILSQSRSACYRSLWD